MRADARTSRFIAKLFVGPWALLALSFLPVAAMPADPTECPKRFASLDTSSRFLRAIPELMELYAKSGGFTYNPSMGGDMSGKAFIAVNAFPERTLVLPHGKLSEGVIRKYIHYNSDLLSYPQVSLGAWLDQESGLAYLDVSLTLPAKNQQQREAAISLGRKFNQIAVYDLEKRALIKTMGDGAVKGDLPPIHERLRQTESLR